MFNIERYVYGWEGNYMNPTKEGYSWKEVDTSFHTEEEADKYCQEKVSNPFCGMYRIVHNGVVVATYEHWQGKVLKK